MGREAVLPQSCSKEPGPGVLTVSTHWKKTPVKSSKPQPGTKHPQALEGATLRLNKGKESFQHQLMTTPPPPTPDYSSETCHYSQMIPR